MGDRDGILGRELRLIETGKLGSQRQIFKEIQKQYPTGTVFVALPMDMKFMGVGDPAESIEQQHENLLKLAKEMNGLLIPFYAADPRREDIVERVRENLGKDKFRGIKIYPNLGYRPNDERLMEVYGICEKGGYPVISHCAPGGVWKYGLNDRERRSLGSPANYKKVLETYPKLKLCLAHFGGIEEWDKHLKGRAGSPDEEKAWVKIIYDMITSGDYPNLYTDIAYTIFTPKLNGLYIDMLDYLKVLLTDEHIRTHVLFGSDYYMVEQEEMSEKEVSVMLRSRLGEELFFQIAHRNPMEFLGSRQENTKDEG
jgi:predicted TIM-barrel fold metal-dependent hydrolase